MMIVLSVVIEFMACYIIAASTPKKEEKFALTQHRIGHKAESSA